MFRHIFEACASLFLLQGALLVPFTILLGMIWYRQSARLEAVGAALDSDRKRHDRTLRSLLTALPKLVPLNCPACGGAVSLGVAATECVSCHTRFPPPADYAATVSLRRRLHRLTRAAVFHWSLARVLTSGPMGGLFTLAIAAEPTIFLITLIGASTDRDSWLDRLLERLGEGPGAALALLGFGGFVIGIVAFIMLAGLARDLRTKLPVFPVSVGARAAETAFATCRSCGGGIQYDRRAFAALCGYCGIENYRADHGRQDHAEAAGERSRTRASLFGAMRIVEEFTGIFFFTMAIMVGAFLLLSILVAVRD